MSGAAGNGLRLAAEWEPHSATWLAWPHRRATWLGDFDLIPPLFARLARLIARFEPVKVIATGGPLDEARRHLGGVAGVELIDIPTSDAWIRDTGPVFLAARSNAAKAAAVCWTWNAWGESIHPGTTTRRLPGRSVADSRCGSSRGARGRGRRPRNRR